MTQHILLSLQRQRTTYISDYFASQRNSKYAVLYILSKKKKKKGWMTEWLSECMYVRMYKVEWINESMNERIAWNEMATEY